MEPHSSWGTGPGEPTLSHRTRFLPGPAFKLKEKHYENWQIVAIVDFVKKLCQQKGLRSTSRGLGRHKVLPLQSGRRRETHAEWFETATKATGHTARSAHQRSPGTRLCRREPAAVWGYRQNRICLQWHSQSLSLMAHQKKENKTFVKTYQEVLFCSAGPSW